MTEIIGAPALDEALAALSATVKKFEERGERTLVFCEDRLTLLAERALLWEKGGTFLSEVTTFRRFLKMTGEERTTLSKQGSVLAVGALLHANEKNPFRRNAAEAVYETCAQLSASCVDGQMLAAAAEGTEGILKRKLEGLAEIFGAYRDFLKDRGLLDENGYLALLPKRIEEGALADVNAVFFAFPSFTRQAQAGIRAAMRGARSVTGIFLAGKEPFYTNEAAHVFRKIAEEEGETHVSLQKPNFSPETDAIRRSLYSIDHIERKRATHVRFFSPLDEDEEMMTVAALIKKYTSEGKRYRDMAVLVAGEDYFLPAEKAFRAFGIPYYADVKRKFSEHPFCTFLLSVLEGAGSGVLPDEADAIASSRYFGGGERYRNYLARFAAYRGGVRREIVPSEILGEDYGPREELERARGRMLAILSDFKMTGKAAKASFYCDAIRKLRKTVDEAGTTERLKAEMPEDAAFLSTDPLEGVLKETEAVAGGETFTPREFAALLQSGFEALSVSLFPRRADAVFVGDITESKIYRADILFAAGLTEELPRVSEDTAVITDGELARLSSLKVEIDPAIKVVNARAREALALNLLAFGEELYLSCPKRRAGAATVRSEVFYYLENAFEMAPMPEIYPYDRSCFAPALMQYFRGTDLLCGMQTDGFEELSRRTASLGEVLKGDTFRRPVDPEKLTASTRKTEVMEAADLWLSRRISPTGLEAYFECPYKGFMMRALRLSDREERRLFDSAESGSFIHKVLERTALRFPRAARDPADPPELGTEEEVRAYALEVGEELLKGKYSMLADIPDGSYLGEKLKEEAALVTVVNWRQLKNSAYKVRDPEFSVSIPDLKLKGTVDRVDESDDFVRIVDYKTGNFSDKVSDYYTGQKLQLELYLKASVKDGKQPAGAFYYPASNEIVREEKEGNRFVMSGFYCSDPEAVSSFGPATEKIFCVKGNGMDKEAFDDFLSYAELVAKGAEEEISEGYILPSPYGDDSSSACTYCHLGGLCGYCGEKRNMRNIKAGTVVDIVRAAKEKQ